MPAYDRHIYTREQFLAENELAHYMKQFVKAKCSAIPWCIEGLKHNQPDAVINACTKPLSILTGPAGTGKTTTLKRIIASYRKAGLRGLVFAPTGKAAKRADEVINEDCVSFIDRIETSTIHSGLEYEPQTGGFIFDRYNRLKIDFLVMDEGSMPGCLICRDLFEAINPFKTRVVISGDPFQLLSVDPGAFLRDIIQSNIFPTVQLDKVLRTGLNSGVTHNANLILRGQDISVFDPETQKEFSDFYCVPKNNEEATVKTILEWITEKLPERRGLNPIKDIQLLCPGKNSTVGTKLMNEQLRALLNPDKSGGKAKLEGFRIGDKVINNHNIKKLKIVNGDVGFVKDIVRGQSGSHVVFEFGKFCGPNSDGIVEMKGDFLNNVSLAYALTVHKFQGSETPCLVMPVHKTHTMQLTRNLLYTGLTRAKQLGILLGDPVALHSAIRNTKCDERVTRLCPLLRAAA